MKLLAASTLLTLAILLPARSLAANAGRGQIVFNVVCIGLGRLPNPAGGTAGNGSSISYSNDIPNLTGVVSADKSETAISAIRVSRGWRIVSAEPLPYAVPVNGETNAWCLAALLTWQCSAAAGCPIG